jgi:hypothetical protein
MSLFKQEEEQMFKKFEQQRAFIEQQLEEARTIASQLP